MRSSKIAFILLVINLLLIYAEFTMHIINSNLIAILVFLNIPLVLLLFLVRKNILEFLKYIVYLMLILIVFNYIKPYITYRGENYLQEIALLKKYQERCLDNITNENKLKKSINLWERDYHSQKNDKLTLYGINKYKIILFFIDSNNSINTNFKIEDNMSATRQTLNNMKKIERMYDIEYAIKDIVNLKKENRTIYKKENICYLSQKYGLIDKIKKEDYKEKEVQEFLLEICKEY